MPNLEVMEFETTQNSTTAKLPILKLGEYEMWEMRIKQYFQVQDYALWEVIENEKINKKNDVKARSLLLMALPNKHLLTFSQYTNAKTMYAVIKTRFGGFRSFEAYQLSMRAKDVLLGMEKIFINANETTGYDKSKVECFNCHKMGHFVRECRAPRNKDGQFSSRNQESLTRTVNIEDTFSKVMLAIDDVGFDWSDIAEEQIQTNMALIGIIQTLAATYKRGLATVEDQLVTFRKNEVLFGKEITVLKREVGCKDYEIGVLKAEYEKVKQEKEGYHVVAPPHPLSLNAPTKLDLYYSGLNEFKEPEFNGYGPRDTVLKSTIDCDSEYENFKENSDDSLVKEHVFQDENNSVESALNVVKETIFHAAKKVEVVKPKNNEKPVRKTV
ncbi:putative ribonuclease H-like domain-containing protein, partial [Tanacetum coccineum]